MRNSRKHHHLLVWQEGMNIVDLTYKITSKFPDSEKFGLISQMQRCAVSIPSNIADKIVGTYFEQCFLGIDLVDESYMDVANNESQEKVIKSLSAF